MEKIFVSDDLLISSKMDSENVEILIEFNLIDSVKFEVSIYDFKQIVNKINIISKMYNLQRELECFDNEI